MSGDNSNSCVETPAAPEWLSKLENRREKLKQTRLGHEAGAGAPCTECGDKCPGLDLHFWRKVCRNCKCRKDQHICADDDLLSGWAQFEILGQIRSKPAFIKIKALASAPVQLEWVPPNATPDVVSDYMDKLGTTKIPVAGSDAAYKRKQQLEFQVPPHDLDAALCDNLTESEAMQLEQYVQKIRENCVGQGNVVRIGRPGVAHVGHVMPPPEITEVKPAFVQVMASINEVPVNDPVLCELLSTDKLAKALLSQEVASCPRMFVVFSEPICESTQEFQAEPMLSQQTKQKLCGLNKQVVESLVQNGPIYEKILAVLKHKNLDVSRDPKLGPIADFRKEYVKNPRFKQEIDSVCNAHPQFSTPIKSALNNLAFNSPLPLKNPIQARFSAQMRQDTPLRKVKFGGVSTVMYDCDLPVNVDYERDPIFAQILSGEPLAQAFKNIRAGEPPQPVVLALTPLPPDYMDEPTLSTPVKQQLQRMGVDTKALQSALLNGRFYDSLFNTLNDKGIDYSDCKLLRPLKLLRDALVSNKPLFEEVRQFVAQMPNNAELSYATPQYNIKDTLSGSRSSDSGFDSKPSTPNQVAFPSLPLAGEEMLASAGRFACIPGIEDMNMYPTVEPGVITQLPHAFRELQIAPNGEMVGSAQVPAPVLHCRDCQQPIHFGDVAVKAERAGREIAWHPECFKCHTCRELLADLVYFFHGGQVYCGRDLAIKLKIPRCKACDELIFTKEYTAAESATFHVKHFCCYHCDTPLAGQKYIPDEKSNMPLCLKCYDEFFATACQRCRQIIGPTDQGVAWGDVHWHGPCFLCAGANCGKSLIGGRFCVKQNLPFCSPACVRSIIK